MGQGDPDQKTEAPTPKRKQDAARKGDVLQSREFAATLVTGAGIGCLAFAGPEMAIASRAILSAGLSFGREDVVVFAPLAAVRSLLEPAGFPLAIFGLATLLTALAGSALLGSFGFRAAAVAPKWTRLDPLAGMKRIFGVQAASEFGKACLKLTVFAAIGAFAISSGVTSAIGLAATEFSNAIGIFGADMLALMTVLTGGLAVIAIGDIFVQRFLRLRRLRMSRQDIRDEMKESEGSPETRHFARQRRQELLASSMRRAVGQATVVLNNPTHFSVALRYRLGVDAAPAVVARGCNEAASAIRQVASEAGIPQLDCPELARAIYFTSRAGQFVKDDLFAAVATILAFVFALDPKASVPKITVPGNRRFDEEGRRI